MMKHTLLASTALLVSATAAALSISTRPVLRDRYDGAWTVRVAGAAGPETDYSVLDMDGNCVAGPFALNWFAVHSPRLWSDEKPERYRLVAVSGTNREEKVFGFRTMVVRDGLLVVNGRPVRVRFAPKALGGNAAPASAISEEDALAEGIYAIPGDIALQIAHERPRATDTATAHAFRNWSATATNYFGRVVVKNRNSFTDAEGVRLFWSLLVDGEETDDGEFDLRGLGPGRSTSFDMPPEVEEARFGGGTVSIRFKFVKDGKTLAIDQTDVVESRGTDPLSDSSGGDVGFERSGDEMTFTSGGWLSGRAAFALDAGTGLPSSYRRGGFMGFGGTDVVAVAAALEGEGAADCASALSVSPVVERNRSLSVTTVSRSGFHQQFRVDTSVSVASFAEWTAYPSGAVACSIRLSPSKNARAGVAFTIRVGGDATAEWFGLGPDDNSPGDNEGVFLGRWRRDFSERPIAAESVRGVGVGGFAVRTLGAPFAIRVQNIGDGLAQVFVFAAASAADGPSDLSFTMSANDGDLTARSFSR